MIHIGRVGKSITEENLATLNEGLEVIAGADQVVTAEDVAGIVEHLEMHNLPDGETLEMGLPGGAGFVQVQRIMGGWNVTRLHGRFIQDE